MVHSAPVVVAAAVGSVVSGLAAIVIVGGAGGESADAAAVAETVGSEQKIPGRTPVLWALSGIKYMATRYIDVDMVATIEVPRYQKFTIADVLF